MQGSDSASVVIIPDYYYYYYYYIIVIIIVPKGKFMSNYLIQCEKTLHFNTYHRLSFGSLIYSYNSLNLFHST